MPQGRAFKDSFRRYAGFFVSVGVWMAALMALAGAMTGGHRDRGTPGRGVPGSGPQPADPRKRYIPFRFIPACPH